MKILVVAKAPIPGTVKTRLCPPLNPTEAAGVAAAALSDTLTAVSQCRADERWIALDGPPGAWLPEGFTVVPQRGITFSERLAHAWDSVGGPALQIGMDTPQVRAHDLDEGCDALLRSPGAVLGPAHDGGWWALGLMTADRRVFDRIPMSTPDTGGIQLQRLEQLGLGPDLLPALIDVDNWSDALEVARLAPTGSFGKVVTQLASRQGGSPDLMRNGT